MVQLYFCEESHVFYTEALLKLDLRRYLFFQLKTEGYSGVFFTEISGTRTIRILTCDRASSSVIRDYYDRKKSENIDEYGDL